MPGGVTISMRFDRTRHVLVMDPELDRQTARDRPRQLDRVPLLLA